WLSQARCPTANLADCQNTGSASRFSMAAYQCLPRSFPTRRSSDLSAETCNGVDDDCNGPIDDVPGVGTACTGGGVNTTGACTASYAGPTTARPGPTGLTCRQPLGPQPETCDGLDNNCNGTVDDNPI